MTTVLRPADGRCGDGGIGCCSGRPLGPLFSEICALCALRALCVNLFPESSSAPSLRTLRFCVIFFFLFSPSTHYPLLTTHWYRP